MASRPFPSGTLAAASLAAAALLWLCGGAVGPARGQSPAAVPVFSDDGPDAAAYGAAENYPVGTAATSKQQRFLVGSFSHFDRLFSSHPVPRAAEPSPLRRAAREISVSYTFRSATRTIEEYLDRNPATGLLVAKDDEILFEHYRYGRTDRDRFTSQSTAKTIVAMLIGIAVEEGAIHSIDDLAAAYVPELAGTQYGATPIRALLHMASGVASSEDYGGADDLARFRRALFRGDGPAASIALFDERTAPPGTAFHYASIETELLGLILRRAVGMPLSDYLRSRIWEPIGAEADATWVTDPTGQDAAYCCFNAVLRDYARFALLLAHDGEWRGRQIIPRRWLLDATTVADGESYLAPRTATPFYGYGYQVWLLPGQRRMFALLGIHGQTIFVDPASRLVMVQTAVRVLPSKDPTAAETVALWYGLVKQVAAN